MKKIIITLAFAWLTVTTVCAQQLESAKVLQTYVDQNNSGIYYNLLKVNDTTFLLLKDTKNISIQSSADSSMVIRSYLKDWAARQSGARDGRDYFLIQKDDFRSMESMEKVGISGHEFVSGSADYKMRWSAPYKATIETITERGEVAANVAMGAVLYCCGNHKPSPHCNEDVDKLGAGCTDIKVKI